MSAKMDIVSAAYSAFFQALIRRNLRDLTNALYQLLEMPVLVNNDIAYNLSQAPAHTIDDPDWDYLVTHKNSTPEHFSRFYEKYIVHSDLVAYPIRINDGSKRQHAQLFSVLRHKDRVLGYSAVLLPEENYTPKAEELQVIRMFNSAATELLITDAQMIQMNSKQSEQTFSDLLSFGGVLTPSHQAYVDNLAVRYRPPYRILIAKNTRAEQTQADGIIVSKLCRDISIFDDHMLAVAHQDCAVTLCSQCTGAESEQRYASLLSFLGELPFRVGISSTFDTLLDAYNYYVQAELTLSATDAITAERVVWFEEITPSPVFSAFAEKYAIVPFLHPVLRQIYLYDKENKTCYLQTLEIYLRHMQDNKSAAQSLFIHINTLLYRIGRLKELFQIDFKDYAALDAINCSFHLLHASPTTLDELLDPAL